MKIDIFLILIMKHRGRIQAQGENIEESESWSQNKSQRKRMVLR